MALVPLQFEPLNVPTVDQSRSLLVCIANVVATYAGEELSLALLILPLFELPVLAVDKDSDDARPPRVSEVRYAIVHIKGDCTISDTTSDSHHLRWHASNSSGLGLCVRVLDVMTILQEALYVRKRHITRCKHGWNDDNWVGTNTEIVCCKH